jgi:Papain family cysteine protease
MPARRFTLASGGDIVVDARPDRADIRDRIFSPQLRTVPEQFPPDAWVKAFLTDYTLKCGLILDQGSEGACTGFGLAAVINFLNYRRYVGGGPKGQQPVRISPRMLYHLARIYDEWPGDDYEGSSCRGAMKGWFHHGVCAENLWRYVIKRGRVVYEPPREGWQADAAKRTLGAYYRIARDSIADMQAAIAEVGAVYCSASVHDGWGLGKSTRGGQISQLPQIAWRDGMERKGGHAFAFVGYDTNGFIVQNSWGRDWGYLGFARLSYEDWIANGSDAWVAVSGVPANGAASDIVLSSSRTLGKIAPRLSRGLASGATEAATKGSASKNAAAWPLDMVVRHGLALDIRGRADRITVTHKDGDAETFAVGFTNPDGWLRALPAGSKKRVMIYCHGGLNDLDAAILRASVLGPCFYDNGVYPIFVMWRSGIWDSIKSILAGTPGDAVDPSRGLGDVGDKIIELLAAIPGSALWGNMKNRCDWAAGDRGGVTALVAALGKLQKSHPDLEIHLVGHSAGAIMIGEALPGLARAKIKPASVSLYAPACTARFALDTYGAAFRSKALTASTFTVDLLSDPNEKDDPSMEPYDKSLLYLVSRAFESHKTPLLGMHALWPGAIAVKDSPFTDLFGRLDPVVAEFQSKWPAPAPRILAGKVVADEEDGAGEVVSTQPASHGCFDNWIGCITATINRILGKAETAKLPKPIRSLKY